MPTLEFLQELRNIVAHKPGIFPVAQARLDNKQLELLLQQQAIRTNVSFDIGLIKISELKNSIDFFKNETLTDNRKISHLGFIYGLETNGTTNKMKLVVTGVRLNDSPTADLTLGLEPQQLSSHQFSDADLVPGNLPGRKAGHDDIREKFISFFTPLFTNKKIVHGAYIRIKNLSDALDTFVQEGCNQLKISFGFMEAISPNDWNCFHLIFRGRNSATNASSTSIFSTYDGEEGYSGPKPGCPPFKCKS